MDTSAKAYCDSLTAIQPILGLDMIEVNDWNCCGATEYLGDQSHPCLCSDWTQSGVSQQTGR